MRFTAFLILVFLGAFTGTAVAADAVATSDPSLGETTKAIFDAVMHGSWWAAAAYALVLAVFGARKVMPESWTTGTKGDIIGTATAFVLAFAGSAASVMVMLGAAMSAAVALTALKIGVAAIGGYTIIHKALGWLAAWGIVPAWLMSALKLIGMLVGSNAVKKAEAAGAAAVAAKPSTGTAGNHTIREIE